MVRYPVSSVSQNGMPDSPGGGNTRDQILYRYWEEGGMGTELSTCFHTGTANSGITNVGFPQAFLVITKTSEVRDDRALAPRRWKRGRHGGGRC